MIFVECEFTARKSTFLNPKIGFCVERGFTTRKIQCWAKKLILRRMWIHGKKHFLPKKLILCRVWIYGEKVRFLSKKLILRRVRIYSKKKIYIYFGKKMILRRLSIYGGKIRYLDNKFDFCVECRFMARKIFF